MKHFQYVLHYSVILTFLMKCNSELLRCCYMYMLYEVLVYYVIFYDSIKLLPIVLGSTSHGSSEEAWKVLWGV